MGNIWPLKLLVPYRVYRTDQGQYLFQDRATSGTRKQDNRGTVNKKSNDSKKLGMTVDNATLRKSEFQSVAETVGFCRSLGATLITLSGKDRASFLHNLCTADIKGLAPGDGCELFLTDVRGKTIGFGHAFADSESIILSTAADQADILIPHLNRYLIREDVQFFDQSGNWQQWALCGPQAESFLKEKMGLQISAKNLSHQTATLEGITLHCCRTDFFEYPGFLLQIESTDCEKLLATFTSVAADCDSSVFEFLRVKAGSPIFGVDITPRIKAVILARKRLPESMPLGRCNNSSGS